MITTKPRKSAVMLARNATPSVMMPSTENRPNQIRARRTRWTLLRVRLLVVALGRDLA